MRGNSLRPLVCWSVVSSHPTDEWSGYGIMEGLALNIFHGLLLFNCPNVYNILKCRTQRDIFKRQAQCSTGPPSESKTISVLKSWQSCTWITSFQLSFQPMEWILLSIFSISPGRELQLWNASMPKVTRPEFQKQKIEAINVTCMSVYHDITHIFLCRYLAYS